MNRPVATATELHLYPLFLLGFLFSFALWLLFIGQLIQSFRYHEGKEVQLNFYLTSVQKNVEASGMRDLFSSGCLIQHSYYRAAVLPYSV